MPPDWWGAPQALLWLLTHWRGGLEGRIVAGLTLGAVGLALAAAAGSWLVYQTEAEDVRAGRAAGAAAYRRYVRGSGAFAAIALVLLLVAPLWILFIVPELPLVEPHGANILYDGLSLFVWWIVYDLLSQGLVATRARTVLLGAAERVTGGLARSGARVVLLWLLEARAARIEARAGTVSTWLAAFAVAATYAGLIVIDLAVPAVRPSLPPPRIFLASAWAFYGACVVLPLAVSETARTFLVDRAALASLAGVVRDPSALLGLTIRRVLLVTLPLLLGYASVSYVLAFALASPVTWLVVLGWIVVLVVGMLFPVEIRRWVSLTVPIERTAWAPLAPRVWAWAALAGVPLRGIYVQFATLAEPREVSTLGGKSPALFVSDLFLAHADWRQRDAVVAYALGVARRQSANHRAARGAVLGAVLFLAAIVGFGLLVTTGHLPHGWLAEVLLPLLLLPALAVQLTLIARRRARRRVAASPASRAVAAQYAARDAARDAERFAAELTGDPLALLVGLRTLDALSGRENPRGKGLARTLERRRAAVEALWREPGPRAPWADQPVPVAFAFEPQNLARTVPLAEAPPPEPVPAAPRGT